MDTVTLTIDGRQLTVEKGKTVLQAAIEHGIKVPYYCYHPGIGIDGSCRVCIVKIEKMPKLQTSCSTPAADGMVVSTATPDVVEARASVFEFLLINHPLDCPVCDKGGECPLQDFSYSFGPNESRMEFPRRVFDGEGVKADVDFGPTLMLNRNRCILCTRCVRFMREVDGDAQINIVDRGYGSEIATFQEEGVHSLISGNLMDVCPVGAITTRDYRFKSRPWDNPEAVDTICTFCEKGCNTTAWLKAKPEWAKGARLVRIDAALQPRRQRLLDVRHRPLRLPLDRRRRSPAAPARARRQRRRSKPVDWREALTKTADRIAAAGGTGARAVPAVCARVARRAVPVRPARLGASACRRTASRSAGACARSRSRPRRSSRSRRSTRPTFEGRATSASRSVRPPTATPDLTAFRQQVEQGRVAALYVFDPGPDGSIGDVSWIIERAHVGQAAAADRAGRADDRSRARGRHRAARRLVDGEGRALRQPAGHRSGRLARADRRRATRRKTGRSSSTSASRSARRWSTRAARTCGRTSARAMAAQRRLRRPRERVVCAAGRGADTGCRRPIRPSAGSGT